MTKTLLIAMAVLFTGCDALKPDKKGGRTSQCTTQAVPAKKAAQGQGDPTDAGTPEGASNSSDDSTLPFNKNAGLSLKPAGPGSDVAPAPANPGVPPVDPSTPFPVDECRLPNSNPQVIDRANPPGVDPANPSPETCSAEDSGDDAQAKLALDVAAPGSGAKAEPSPQFNPAGACPSDASATQNVPRAGTNAALKLEWKVLDGLLVYEESKVACAALGDAWRLAEAAELDQLLAQPEFKNPKESNCATSFWTAGARDLSTRCVAYYRGFQYSGVANDPLPINNSVVAQPLAGVDSVLNRHSALCVKGQLKPQVSCGDAAAKFFAERPLGVKDPSGGLTWAKITVKTFTTANEAEAQCALGAQAGWRIPTKGELEAAIKVDLFKTAVYAGADPTCPKAWHKPDDAVTQVTCGGLGADAAGEAAFATGETCPGAAVYGLCVQENPK